MKHSLVCIALATASLVAHAQNYPNKPIRLVVGFPPGGGNDLLARTVSPKLSERLSQSIVVDNKPGAGGNVAAEFVSRAAADGYTILVMSSSHPIQKLLKPTLSYDPIADFTPLARLAQYSYILVINPGVKARSVKALVALAKAEPRKLNFVSSGNGSGSHLVGELFKTATATEMTHVPYKGGAQAITDLVGGRVEMMFSPIPAVMSHIKSGRLVVVATTGSKRSEALPDVPTVAESGFPKFSASSWYGIVGPAKLPSNVSDLLNRQINVVLKEPDVRERLAHEGAEPAPMSREDFVRLIRSDHDKWGKVIAATGITGG
ncbi:MAG TPA: tripartite tricarboxylate transporter substrate binding protein [Burkholderiales bacterium]|nr:tripartite tricarboxylate transporter substrate binding protein [Burkholderiales bacterium]